MIDGAKGARSTFDLLGLLGPEVKEAVSAEIDLARAEVSGAVAHAASAAIFGVIGLVVLIAALMFALVGVIDLLINAGFGHAAATFIVTGILLVIGVICAFVAYSAAKSIKIIPSRALAYLQKPLPDVRTPATSVSAGRTPVAEV